MHQNASDITVAEREARVVRAPPGPKMAHKSMLFINAVLICVQYTMAGICRSSTIKSMSAKLAACQSHRKAAKGLEQMCHQTSGSACRRHLQGGEVGRVSTSQVQLFGFAGLRLHLVDCWTIQGTEELSNLGLMKLFQGPAKG